MDEWLSAAGAADLLDVSIRTVRSLARTGKVASRVGHHPHLPRPWYRAPELRQWVIAYATSVKASSNTQRTRPRKYSWAEAVTKAETARFLRCPVSVVEYLLSINKLHEWARGGLVRGEVFRLKQSIRLLAQTGKLDFRLWPTLKSRKLWFCRRDLQKLIDAYVLEISNEKETGAYHTALRRSDKIARARKYAPGDLVTKADAAQILGCSVRGVEYLMSVGRLRPIRLGHRTVVLKRKKVLSLQRRRRIGPGKKTGVRKFTFLDLTNAVGMTPRPVAQ
jgi:hypothetical protein